MGKTVDRIIFWGGFAAGAYGAYAYLDPLLEHTFGYLSTADWAKQVITSVPATQQMVERFVAGESGFDALRVAGELNQKGMLASLDYLGESVEFSSSAIAARDIIIRLLEEIDNADVDSNASVKLTQLGLKINPELAYENMRRVLDRAHELGNWVRIDMEESAVTEATLDIYHQLRSAGYSNVGIVIQSYLYRSAADIAELVDVGARVRLCKGAYNEPDDVAYPIKADTDANFVRLMQQLLSEEAVANGVKPALATHDNKMIDATIQFMQERNLPKDAVEFQMLYGVRRELQDHLVEQGYPVRIYIPFGEAWYPYLMRRLAERPANLYFFLSNL